MKGMVGFGRLRPIVEGCAFFAVVASVLAGEVVYPLPPEKVDPSTVAETNEFHGGWWNEPYHERYRILVDFDFDGHDDMLLSEPMAHFGTGGGSWTAYHWTNGLYQAVGNFGAHYAAWSFDKDVGGSGGLRFWYYWHLNCRKGMLGYYIISAKGVKDEKNQRFSITMDSDENDVASQLYRTALKDHGIPYRYEESMTRDGIVTWRPSRQREVLGK